MGTNYRDIEALHGAGVAVYGGPGRDGGYRLVDGYRTQLTGLTQDEAAALSLAVMPAAARELGLSNAAASVATKLNAALTEDLRRHADHIQSRLNFDPTAWYDGTDRTAFLSLVVEAVWQDRRLQVMARGLQRLNHLMESTVVTAGAASAAPAGDDGWVETTLPSSRSAMRTTNCCDWGGYRGAGSRGSA